MTHIDVVELPDQLALCIRTRTRVEQLPVLIGESYHRILQYMEGQGISPTQAPYTAYHNMDPSDLDVEMGFPVTREVPDQGDIRLVRLPATPAVAATHQGPYSTMTTTYDAMNRYIAEHHLEPTGLAYEYYMTGPEVPENDHVTRIILPLK